MTARIYTLHPSPSLSFPQGPMSNAHGFPDVERPRVDVTGCLEGYRVWLYGVPYRDFTSITNASRVASALMTLDALECITPQDCVRSMLQASIELEAALDANAMENTSL